MAHTILFVDDEPLVTQALKRALHKEPYRILSAQSASQALEILVRQAVDVVISDEMMPGMLGSEFLAVVCRDYPDTVRIILTGHANLKSAVRAINEGQIYRYLTKPCNEEELIVTLRQALQHKELMAKSRQLLQAVKHQHAFLDDLERVHPGITSVERDSSGVIVLGEGVTDLDALIEEMQAEVKKFEARFCDGEGK
ncbi:MAG TPA: response regulator [Syntrophobacteraceae bacterium]|jgi:two-component system, probable response regulator PhcQ|nr:response regulator [Syntrophobacteraceae bacterium]